MKTVIKIKRLVITVFVASMFVGCAIHQHFVPLAVEDADEGTVLIVKSSEVQQVVENWGLQNGYQYVAYRRLQGGTSRSTEWSASTDQDGTHRSSGRIVYTSQVLVIGMDNPSDAPERFNVITVPSKPNRELTGEGKLLRGAGIGFGAALVVLLLLAL